MKAKAKAKIEEASNEDTESEKDELDEKHEKRAGKAKKNGNTHKKRYHTKYN